MVDQETQEAVAVADEEIVPAVFSSAREVADDTVVSAIFSTSGRNIAALPTDVELASIIETTGGDEHDDRASFICVKITKPLVDALVGISFAKGDQDLLCRITKVNSERLLGSADVNPFLEGDVLLSINNKDLTGLSAAEVAQRIREAPPGFLRMVVQNPSGDPKRVESMVEKPTPKSVVGLSFTGSQSRVKITTVRGLFENSLLNTGDLIVSINGAPRPRTAKDARGMIQKASRFVSIQTETLGSTGAVIAASSFISPNPPNRRTNDQPYGKMYCACALVVFGAIALIAVFANVFGGETCEYLQCDVCGYHGTEVCGSQVLSDLYDNDSYCCDTQYVERCGSPPSCNTF